MLFQRKPPLHNEYYTAHIKAVYNHYRNVLFSLRTEGYEITQFPIKEKTVQTSSLHRF